VELKEKKKQKKWERESRVDWWGTSVFV
jgi:hypothetical protein